MSKAEEKVYTLEDLNWEFWKGWILASLLYMGLYILLGVNLYIQHKP